MVVFGRGVFTWRDVRERVYDHGVGFKNGPSSEVRSALNPTKEGHAPAGPARAAPPRSPS